MFYCMFYFTCDRSFRVVLTQVCGTRGGVSTFDGRRLGVAVRQHERPSDGAAGRIR